MALGTLDRTPPPFFRQGPSALTKLCFCSALAVFLMAADARFRLTQPIRATAATMLYPLQRALLVPVEAIAGGRTWFAGLASATAGEDAARQALARQSERAMRVDLLLQENARLRALLELRPGLSVRSQAAELLYEAADPYSRKVIVDRGVTHNVVLGSPVINEAGVLGQVTRVYLQSSEVTLLTDRDAAIPVLNTRSGARSAAFGGAAVGPAGDALHGGQRRRPGRRPAHHLGRRRRLSAGPRGRRGPGGRPQGRLGLRPHRPQAGGLARRRAPRPDPRADRRAAAAAARGGGVRAGAGQGGEEGARPPASRPGAQP